jgi:hypothetical protein
MEQQSESPSNTIKRIKQKYTIVDNNSCQIAASKTRMPHYVQSEADAVNHSVACMVAGYKNVYMFSLPPTEEFHVMDKELKDIIAQKQFIHFFTLQYPNIERFTLPNLNGITSEEQFLQSFFVERGYAYTLIGTTNAFALAKASLEVILNPQNNNPLIINYVYGELLGYKKEDILTFIQLSEFIDREKLGNTEIFSLQAKAIVPISPTNFLEWPNNLVYRFNQWEKAPWGWAPGSQNATAYAAAENHARQWLMQNNKGVPALKKDIRALLEKIQLQAIEQVQASTISQTLKAKIIQLIEQKTMLQENESL